MASKLGTWRKTIQQHLFVAIGMMVLLIVLLAFVLAVRWLGWNWTGFNSYLGPKLNYYQYYRPDKTLWDWLELLIIPFMLVVGGFWLNQLQRTRDERAAEERNKRESEIAAEKQKEAVLDTYLDRLAELLLEKGLRDSAEGDEVRRTAHVRTRMALRRLDGTRKALVIRALHDDDLIDKKTCIISLNGAQLQGVQLHRANLSEVNLSGSDLFGAVFSGANLSGANLSGSNLQKTNLKGTNLYQANLSLPTKAVEEITKTKINIFDLSPTELREMKLCGANLSGADLCEANLNEANLFLADLCGVNLSKTMLREADLRWANLSEALNTTPEQLAQAKSLEGATMPDGSKHP